MSLSGYLWLESFPLPILALKRSLPGDASSFQMPSSAKQDPIKSVRISVFDSNALLLFKLSNEIHSLCLVKQRKAAM